MLLGLTKEQIRLIDDKRPVEGGLYNHWKDGSSNYYHFMRYVTEDRGVFLANKLIAAMDGIGCDKTLVNEIFCLHSNSDLQSMKRAYSSLKGSGSISLEDRLMSELGGEHCKLILLLLNSGRGVVRNDKSPDQLAADLNAIIQKGSSMFGGLSDSAELEVSYYELPTFLAHILCQLGC